MSYDVYSPIAKSVEFEWISDLPLGFGQDGAIYNGYLFRFDSEGCCRVYKLADSSMLCQFTIDKKYVMLPHSNSVTFGNEFYSPLDEFPLIYSNVYNNYAHIKEDRREGVLCVYRLLRDGNVFSAELVQIIRIGFSHTDKWMSSDRSDRRPYGNFAIDREKSILWAATMRDQERKTRFFSFALPKSDQGEKNKDGVREYTLAENDIISSFDAEYINFMQGMTFHRGYIYSVEGFTNDIRHPGLRIFDTVSGKQSLYKDLTEINIVREPEFIEVYDEKTYFIDNAGSMGCFKFV